jgi:transcriptional antiterminator
MKERYVKILHILQQTSRYTSGTSLSKQLSISARTIRSDVKDLNENYLIGATIVSNKRLGYKIEGTITGFKEKHHLEFEARAFHIVKVLMEVKGRITYEQLAQKLYFSAQTIRSDIQRIVKIIQMQKRDLTIDALIFHGIQLNGEEMEKRLLLESLFPKNVLATGFCPETLAETFPQTMTASGVRKLYDVLHDASNAHLLDVTKEKQLGLLVHLLITIDRLKRKQDLPDTTQEEDSIPYEEYQVAKVLVLEIEKIFNLTFSGAETAYLAIYLISQRLLPTLYDSASHHLIPQKLCEAVAKILEELSLHYFYSFHKDDKLKSGLLYHLSKALYPLQYNLVIENPFITHIKMEYLQAYNIAVDFSHRLTEQIKCQITENEIGYIALHVAEYLERSKKRNIRAALICSNGQATSSIMKQRLERYFPELLITCEHTGQSLDSIHKDVDLLITTIPITQKEISSVCVQQFLSEDDLRKIERAINHGFLAKLLQPGHFIQTNATSKEELLRQLTKQMDIDDILDDILEREELSSTDAGSLIAIPHPLQNVFDDITVYVAVNKTPIRWGERFAQLIFLVIPSKHDQEAYSKVFSELYQLLKNEVKVERLIKADCFEEFIHIFDEIEFKEAKLHENI